MGGLSALKLTLARRFGEPGARRRTLIAGSGVAALSVAGAAAFLSQGHSERHRQTVTSTVVIRHGAGTAGLLNDPNVREVLAHPSFSLAQQEIWTRSAERGADLLWPDTHLAGLQGRPAFYSALIVVARQPLARYMTQAGLAQPEETGGISLIGFERLLQAAARGNFWSSISPDAPHLRVRVTLPSALVTDVGVLCGALLARAWRNETRYPTPQRSIPEALADLLLMGGVPTESRVIADLTTPDPTRGGTLGLITERALVEWALGSPDRAVRGSLVPLYPRPTLWATHPLLPLSRAGAALSEDFRKPALQRLAWRRHGLRASSIHPADGDHGVTGLPARSPIADEPPALAEATALAMALQSRRRAR